MKRRGTWTFCGSTGVFLRIVFWIGVSHRDATYRWPCANTFAVGQGWWCLQCRFLGKTLVYGGKQKPGWMIFWNLEHGHKNRLLLIVFFSKDSKGLCSVVFFLRNLETQIFNLHVLQAKRRKQSIWMCCHLQSIWIRILNSNNCGKCQGFDPTWVF